MVGLHRDVQLVLSDLCWPSPALVASHVCKRAMGIPAAALMAFLKGLTQEPISQCLTLLKPGEFLLQVRNHWAFGQESPVITAVALEAMCKVEKPGVGGQ